jgi:O-antigen/teichoic acid export membrane protein
MTSRDESISGHSSLLQQAGLVRYARNTSWLLAEKLLRFLAGMFVGIWIARYLGPTDFGILSYAQSFVIIFLPLATLGMDSIIVRKLVEDSGIRDAILGTAFCIKFVGSLLTIMILAFAVQVPDIDGNTISLIFVISLATIFQSLNVIDFYYQSKVLSKYVAIVNSVSLSLSSIIKIILILNSASLTSFAIASVVEASIVAVGLVYCYQRKSRLGITSWTFDKRIASSLIRESWPWMLSFVAVSAYMKMDVIMIRELMGTGPVGQYAAAIQVSEAWYFIPMALISSVFPAIVSSRSIGAEIYYSRLQQLYSFLVWFAICTAIATSFIGDWLVMSLYGKAYHDSVAVLMIHIWAGVFVSLGAASGKWYLLENYHVLAFARTFLGLLVNLGLNLFLIPKYGINGAAISTLLSYAFAGFMFDLFCTETRDTFFMKLRAIAPIKRGFLK